jgi:ABC-2 type transport system ATP-binding protein
MIATMQAEAEQMVMPKTAQPVVASLTRVSKKFENLTALDSIDFKVHAGELVALLGPNGAGKTTAVKLLLGLARPTAGVVSVFGGDPLKVETRARTGAMLQVAKVPETLRVREHIDLFSSYYPAPLPMAETLSIAGLEEIRDREFGELSGGQKQRVLFALALCGDPDLVFLDEPTVGMDVEARRSLWQQIRKLIARGKTVLLTTHYLEEADALADRIVVINRGQIIAEGTPEEIKKRTSGHKIRCRSELAVDTLREFPAVTNVSKTGPWVEIRTTAPESVLRELLLRDLSVGGIEVTSAGLEEAFLALTSDETAKK